MSDDVTSEAVTVRFVTDTAHGRGSKLTSLRLDGHELARFCRAVTVSSRVGEPNVVEVELLALEGLVFDLPVAVAHVAIRPLTSWRIVSEVRGDRVYYWTEPESRS